MSNIGSRGAVLEAGPAQTPPEQGRGISSDLRCGGVGNFRKSVHQLLKYMNGDDPERGQSKSMTPTPLFGPWCGWGQKDLERHGVEQNPEEDGSNLALEGSLPLL